MRNKTIERVIRDGSVKQKIKLYMTDIALCNITDFEHLNYNIPEGGGINITGTKLLSNKERDLLWGSIKDPKDIEYYEGLRTWNKAFLLFKDRLIIINTKILASRIYIYGQLQEYNAHSLNEEVINDLLQLYPDKKSREKAFNKALELTKDWGGIKYQEEGYPPYITIDENGYFKSMGKAVSSLNKLSKDAKLYIDTFKRILSKLLPLQPYKDWVMDEEKKLKNTLQEIYNTIAPEDIGYSATSNPKVKLYDEIEVQATPEDIEDFKNAGL